MNILYIGNKIEKPKSGGDQINYRNQRLLESVQGNSLTYVPIMINTICQKLMMGATKSVVRRVKEELKSGNYTHVFFSQSFFGRLHRVVKKCIPEIEVITFFHNVEKLYAREYMKISGVRALPVFLNFWYNEYLCCQYTDSFVTLNRRDSLLLEREYNVKANLELPTSLSDKFEEARVEQQLVCNSEDVVYLFVGVAFFANVEGIKWFIDNVFAHIKGRLIVAGSGMDKAIVSSDPRVSVLGFVDDLSSLYYSSTIVISPILSGAGMKTKTAEALMYGKTIVGTQEAFEGYEADDRCMFQCDDAKSFVKILRELSENRISKFNPFARGLFARYYNFEASLSRLRTLL